MDDSKIKYEDLISPDDSIKNLIGQLEELNKTYTNMLETIKAGAREVVSQLKSMNASTIESRSEIDESTIATNRLARAQRELRISMTDVGKEIAWLKAQTIAQNRLSADMKKQANSLIGSYDAIQLELKQQIQLWKSLSAEQRSGAFGAGLLQNIINIKARVHELDEQLKLHVQNMSEVQKAEQKLAFLQSEEGQRLLELKRQIREVISANSERKQSVDEVTKAMQRYRAASSETNIHVQELNQKTQEANRIAKLTAKLNNSATGSYNQLSAQYELNKLKLNAMSHEERYATAAGKDLEEQTLRIYKQMIKMQEATGNHRLSVGNYKLAWNGLGNAMTQIIRELPAATMGINTFFLAISNNIPILIDEINRVKATNKLLQAEGKATTSVVKTLTNAIFSWQTALVIVLTALSMNGKAILEWIGNLSKSHNTIKSTDKLLKDVTKELEKTTDSYGQNIVNVKKLAREWQNLSSKKEQLQWIRDNKTEFDKLNISITNVKDAENAFVDNTSAVIESLRLRTKAAAAMKLAADKYEEALRKQLEVEQEEYTFERVVNKKTGAVTIKRTKKNAPRTYQQAGIVPGTTSFNTISGQSEEYDAEENWSQHLKRRYDEVNAIETEADALFELSEAFNQEADARLKSANIEKAHKKDKKSSRERHPRQRDLTDQIWRNDLTIRKKYELSISALQRDEFQKRRIEAIDATNATIREMQEKFRKNQDFLTNKDGKYKPLTAEQRKQIEEQQNEINAIIENSRRKLQIDLQKIDDEQQVDSMKKLREMMDNRLSIITEDLEKEKQLRLEQLDTLEGMYATKARSSSGGEIEVTAERRTPEQIAEFHRQRMLIEAEYDAIIYRLRQQSIDNEIELVKKGTIEELDLLLQRNEIARNLALAENKLKPASERQSEDQINAVYDKNRLNIYGNKSLSNFDEAQAKAEAEFMIVKRNENQITIFKLQQERDRWKKQIQLAKEGALDWSDAQLKQAEAMIQKLQREIEEAESFAGLIGKKGFGGALLTKLGFDDDQIEALTEAVNIILDNIKAIADAEVEAAEKAVEAAEKRVDAAQRAYDAEIEARNNGYANNVATAKKELQQEQRNQAQKQKLLEEAQRRQEAINTVIQASSLITASANLWSAFSTVPIIGPALAIAAIAAMWGSFALAKIRAAQITKASQEYGEGGLEFLEGGSHASGNDIDLQTKNSKGKNMRAEGGEALAIINKRSTRKYRKLLPQIVDNINKGTFEDKFTRAFDAGERILQSNIYSQNIDLSQLENDVKALKRNSEYQCYIMPDGSRIEKKNNITRRIH